MEKMLTKFESKSNRVKGLSFHPVRPWIVASLHNGQIQLWDYRMGTCLDKFEEHDGPVRGVDFHRTQSLIVSGGDDYKVKVWDYKLRRCLFTLLGHLDYIRSVQFHNEYPWIVSASDDQTIRIWNWQSRNCISVLTGHNHYVMCAAFHPKDDMIVSASLDQTVRVWDTSGLRKKTVRGAPPMLDEGSVVSKVNNELFGGNDATVRYVLEGHERGVNWASFHPTLPLIISGADDRQVKLWRMNETKAWEVDTMRGHTNNVSCVLFHPKHELIISNSEDRTIRVWDISKRLGVQTFRRENDRFWILAAHPDQNVLAAGHDSGMTVFKLERERPAYDTVGSRCFYVKDRYLRMHEFAGSKDVPLVSLRRTSASTTPGIGGGPRTLAYNTFNKNENNVLVLSDMDGGSYELITFGLDGSSSGDAQDIRRGAGVAAVFIARDRFAVLEKWKQLCVKNFQNEVVKKSTPTLPGVDGLFGGGTNGRVLLRSDDRVVLHDFQARKNIAELQVARVKYVVWNHDSSLVAIISKHQIVLANKQLEQLCVINETVRLKGGCWDPSKPIFVYTTSNHIKYLLCNGDQGIVRGLDAPVYVTKLLGNQLYCLDREGKMRTLEVDLIEALFKLALENKEYGEVTKMVKNSRLCGQSIITYLQEKGYPEVALHFVHDNRTRFKLALACGNIQIALNVAYELDEDAWHQLGTEALRQGNFEIVEMAYQKTKNFDQLSFLYLITGNTEKLRKMMKIAEMRDDVMSSVHNSLYLGDVEERIKSFESAGQLSLSFLMAATHGLDSAHRLQELLTAANLPIPDLSANSTLLLPPTPIFRGDNWPLLSVTKSMMAFADNRQKSGKQSFDAHAEDEEHYHDAVASNGDWGDDDLFDDEVETSLPKTSQVVASKSGWEEDDLDLSDDDMVEEKSQLRNTSVADFSSTLSTLTSGQNIALSWCSESSHCADHFAAGAVESAIQLLNRQIGAVNLSPLKSSSAHIFSGAYAFSPGLLHGPPCKNPLLRENGKSSLPAIVFSVQRLLDSLKQAYRLFTSAQFDECQQLLEAMLLLVPLTNANTKTESDDLRELLSICKEYLIAIKLKSSMDASTDNVARSLELAAYFTHCNLQPPHMMLALKTAMAVAFKNKNFVNAASFSRRLLDYPEISSEKNADLRSKAQKVLQKSEQQGRNEHSIDYDERNPFNLDCGTFLPLYKGTPFLRCSYCSATFGSDFRGKLCGVCNISTVGIDTVGLVSQSKTRK